jgi:glycerol kinase
MASHSNDYLMQLQADLTQACIKVSGLKNLSLVVLAISQVARQGCIPRMLYFSAMERHVFEPRMSDASRMELSSRWHEALHQVLSHNRGGKPA